MMNKLWTDYKDLFKHNCRFMKEHWVAITALNAILVAAEVGYYAYEMHKLNKECAIECKNFQEYWHETFRNEDEA